MAGKNVLEINDLNFETEVLQSKEPFLLDFSAVWCGPCKMLTPIVEKIADENVGHPKKDPGHAQGFEPPAGMNTV